MFDQRFDKQNFACVSQKLMWNRFYGAQYENTYLGKDQIECFEHTRDRLNQAGGIHQQDRLIRDKRRSLDRAVLYSYQGALIKKVQSVTGEFEEEETRPVHALINPNKLKQDYDDKIVSVGYEFDFHSGDVFEWCNTGTYWLIYLQDLQELAYFRGDIRRCSYTIDWMDGDEKKSTYAAVRGPVETKIDFIQKHGISVDEPNYSLSILMPKNKDTMQQFQRYSKFYLRGAEEPDSTFCWRVEATDSISTPGILEVVAVKYYSNETEDDVENGLVGALIPKKEDPNGDKDEIIEITGETFIKPKLAFSYYINLRNKRGDWSVDKNAPVKLEFYTNDKGFQAVRVKWTSSYSGQFVLRYGDYEKTIVVESLF